MFDEIARFTLHMHPYRGNGELLRGGTMNRDVKCKCSRGKTQAGCQAGAALQAAKCTGGCGCPNCPWRGLARTSATDLVLKRLKRENAHRRGVTRPGRKPAWKQGKAETRQKRGFSGAFEAKKRGKRGKKPPRDGFSPWENPPGRPEGAGLLSRVSANVRKKQSLRFSVVCLLRHLLYGH